MFASSAPPLPPFPVALWFVSPCAPPVRASQTTPTSSAPVSFAAKAVLITKSQDPKLAPPDLKPIFAVVPVSSVIRMNDSSSGVFTPKVIVCEKTSPSTI